jgi:nitronate monooxygenase
MSEMDSAPENILPMPWQNQLTGALRREAAKQNRAEFLSLWAGQGMRLARGQSAGELVARLAAETTDAISRIERVGSADKR